MLREAYEEFEAIALTDRTKPVIGVVGEIYIRSNRFSNENIVRQIEMLGGEAWVAPVSEWLLYLTATAADTAKMNRSWKALAEAYWTAHIQQRDERRMASGFNGSLRSLHEPSIEETLRRAEAVYSSLLSGGSGPVRGQSYRLYPARCFRYRECHALYLHARNNRFRRPEAGTGGAG